MQQVLKLEKKILAKIQEKRKGSVATLADIRRILLAKVTLDWSEVYESRLYKEHSSEYCELLEYMPSVWMVGVVMPSFEDQRYLRDRDMEVIAYTAEDAKKEWFEHYSHWIRPEEKHLVQATLKEDWLK